MTADPIRFCTLKVVSLGPEFRFHSCPTKPRGLHAGDRVPQSFVPLPNPCRHRHRLDQRLLLYSSFNSDSSPITFALALYFLSWPSPPEHVTSEARVARHSVPPRRRRGSVQRVVGSAGFALSSWSALVGRVKYRASRLGIPIARLTIMRFADWKATWEPRG